MKLKELSNSGRLVLFAPTLLIYVFSTWPQYQFHGPDESQLVVSFKKKTERVHDCTPGELDAFKEAQSGRLKHMRTKSKGCGSRDRLPLELVVKADGQEKVRKILQPAGLSRDGVVFAFERLNLAAGEHDLYVSIRDYKPGQETPAMEFGQKVEFKPRHMTLVTFTPEEGGLHIKN